MSAGGEAGDRRASGRRATDATQPAHKEGAITQALRVQLSGTLDRFPWLQRPALYELFIAIVVLLLFGRAVTFGFINFEDGVHVAGNALLNPPTGASLWQIWRGAFEGAYVPLFYSSLWLDAVIGRGTAGTFHLTNVLLHVGSALLVLGILRRVGESFAFLEALPVPHKEYRKLAAATMGALMFACHPAQAEAVCWISGRRDVLCGFLALASVYCYLIAAGPPVSIGGLSLQKTFAVRGRSYWLGLLWFALALLVTPTVLVLPLAILGINTLLLRRPMYKSVVSLMPWFVLSGIWLVLLIFTRSGTGVELPPVWQRPALASDCLVFYARLMIWPRNLVTVYDRPMVEVLRGWQCWGDLLLVLSAALMVVQVIRRGYRVLPAIAVLFLVPLLPVVGLVPFSYLWVSTVANRFLYLPLLSLGLVYAWMWLAAATHPIPRARRSLNGGLVLVALGHALSQTPGQVRSWQNSRTLWAYQQQRCPTAKLPAKVDEPPASNE